MQILFIYVFGLVKHSSFLLLYLLLYSYGISLLGIGMIVATFFSDSKVRPSLTVINSQ